MVAPFPAAIKDRSPGAEAEPALYQAQLLADPSGRPVADRSGSVGRGEAVVRFPQAVTPGNYRIRVKLVAAGAPARATTLEGKPFRVVAPTPKPKPAGPVFAVVG